MNRSFKVIVGEGSPMHMDSENVCINEHYLNEGSHSFEIGKDLIHSYFIIDGEIILDNMKLEKAHFLLFLLKMKLFLNLLKQPRFLK